MIKIYGQKSGQGIQYPPAQALIHEDWLNKLKEGDLVVAVYKRYRPHKTWNQVKNHFGNAIQKIITDFDDRGWDASMLYRFEKPTGVGVNKAMLQQFFYALFPTCNDEGKIITMSDDGYTTEHCSKFFEDIRNFAASQWSIVIPEPDKLWKEK